MTDRKAVYRFFKKFDQLFSDGQFEKADKILRQMNVEKFSPTLIVGILSATFPAKHKLQERKDLFNRCRVRLVATETPRRVERLLGGLE